MTGKIALVGGDEFLPNCRVMDAELLKMTGIIQPKVIIVPTAAATERPMLAAQHGVQQFEALAADADSLMAVRVEDANDQNLLAKLDDADVIYFTGGNPSHLLNVLRESLLLTKMMQALERGAILAGSSAGAMVMGERMRFRQWQDALGIVPGVAVVPHQERSSRGQTMGEVSVETLRGLSVLGIDGATCCVSEGDEWQVLGVGSVTLYKGGSWERFEAGERFTI